MESVQSLPPREWVTKDVLMNHLHIKSANTITQLIKDGLPAHLVGRKYLFDLNEVDAWIVDSRWSERDPGQDGVA